MVLRQLFRSSSRSSRSAYALFAKPVSSEVDDERVKREGPPQGIWGHVRLRSVAEIFSSSKTTAIDLIVVDALADPALIQTLELSASSQTAETQQKKEEDHELSRDSESARTRTRVNLPPSDGKESAFSVTDNMLSRGKQGDARLPVATAPRAVMKSRRAKAERFQLGGELSRTTTPDQLLSGRQERMTQVSQPMNETTLSCKARTPTEQHMQQPARSFVTVDYRSSRRSLRGNRSFREKKVQRHRVPAEVSALLSMFEQGGKIGASSSSSASRPEKIAERVESKSSVVQGELTEFRCLFSVLLGWATLLTRMFCFAVHFPTLEFNTLALKLLSMTAKKSLANRHPTVSAFL